jgi:hypothetical protein
VKRSLGPSEVSAAVSSSGRIVTIFASMGWPFAASRAIAMSCMLSIGTVLMRLRNDS